MSIPDSGLEGFGYDPPVTDENTTPTDPSNPNQQPADMPAPPPEQPSTPPPPPPTPYSTQPPGPMPGATPDSPTVVGMPPPPPPGYAPTPPPGYVAAPPPPPPGYVGGPPPPTYPGQPAYGSAPPPSRGGPPLLLLGGLALILVVLGGLGSMFVLKMGPFAPAPTLIAQPSLLPTATPSALPTGSLPPTPTPAATATPGSTPTAAPTATQAPTDQPTATPTATPGETPSSEPSAEPTSSAAPTPQPTSAVPPTIAPGPDEAADVLLSHIPEEFRANCTPNVGTDPVLALAACSHDDGELLMVYWLYGSREEMNAAYQIYMLGAQIEPDTGDCSDPDSWPTENGYSVSQVNVGRYLCLSSALPTIYWTDDRFNILSQASHALGDYDRLLDFWINEAGPI